MHPKLRYVGGAVVRYRMRRQAARFLQDVANPRNAQSRVLRELLALNSGSDFARRHRFDEIRSAADFRQRVPIADYDYYRPYIERVKQGELSALLGPQNPLLMFALTSGTTSESKFIPITRRFLEDYRRGWKVWGIRAYDDHPALHTQDIVQLSSDHDQFRSPGGHPCGNISGLVSTMQSPIVKTMYTVPDGVAKIKSPDAKYYTALRLSLANPHVGLVMTANPSTLI
ncbi:MAG TPA: GH3 auxin-responsive promoter family protein, partial [Planctomycetaceae bacterium]|nr:GH3 auxin-responsive promoter family protein [Planctomycetaceae bacterium]